MRPNQWVRVTKKDSPNYGRVKAVRSGPPVPTAAFNSWTGLEYSGLAYPIIHAGNSAHGPLNRARKLGVALSENVELLGPEECAALDAEYGLAPKDGE